MMSEILISTTWNQKEILCFVCECFFLCTISPWKFLLKCERTIFIFVFIHGKKTLQCQMCGKHFKNNYGMTKHLQKNMIYVCCPVKDINISDVFNKIQKFLKLSLASIITTNGIGFFVKVLDN